MNGKMQFVPCDDNPSHNHTLTYHLNEMEEMPLPFELALVTTRPQDVLDFAGMSREKGMQTVYLLDLVLEQETMSGLDVCQEIHRRDPKGYIIYVSAYHEIRAIRTEKRAGKRLERGACATIPFCGLKSPIVSIATRTRKNSQGAKRYLTVHLARLDSA